MHKIKHIVLCTTTAMSAFACYPAFSMISIAVPEKAAAASKKLKAVDPEAVEKSGAVPPAPMVKEVAPAAMPAPVAVSPALIPVASVQAAPVSMAAPVVVVEMTMKPNFAPVAPADRERTWKIVPGDLRLANTLDRWTREAGMKLVWDAQKHVIVSTSDTFTGTLKEALSRVLNSPAIAKSSYPLEACIYPNTPPVVRITRKGDQVEECPQ